MGRYMRRLNPVDYSVLQCSMLIRTLEKAGIPTCQIEGDMVDVRDWDDAKAKSQVGSFIETLLESK